MATVATLEAVITADTSQFDSAMGQASNTLNEFQQGAQQAGKGVGNAADQFINAGKLMAVGGALMLAPMVDAVRGAATLEQAMDQVGVAFNATEEQAALLEEAVLDVASSTIFGTKEVADAANILGKAGVDVEDATGGMLQAVADFAAATGTELPTAADIMARTSAQWGISGEDMMGVADDLVTVFNETSLGAEDWLGGMANFAPMSRLVGATLEETGAALGFFKDQGLSAREAGTSLTRAMDAMVSPTDKQTEAMNALGITTEDFFEIAEDGTRQFIGWADTFDMLNEQMADLDDIQKAAALSAIFGKEAFDAMGLGMLSNTDDLRDLTKEMENNTGIARKQSEALTDNLMGSLEQLGGAYDKLRVKMGDPFLAPLQAGVEGVTDLVNALADADPAVQGMVGKFLGLSGGLLTFGGLAALGTGQVLKLAEQFSRAGLSLPKFAAGLGLVGLAIGAGLLAYETNFLGFRDTVDKVMADAGVAMETFGETFGEVFNANTARGMTKVASAVDAFGKALFDATGIDLLEQTSTIGRALDTLQKSFEENLADGVDPWVNALESAGDAARVAGMGDLADQLDDLSLAWGAMADKMTQTEGTMPELNRQLSALQAGAQQLTGLPVEQFFDDLGMAAATAQDDLTDLKNALGAGDWSEVGQILMRDAPNIEAFFNNLGTGIRTLQEGFETFDLGDAAQGVSDQLGEWFQAASDMLLGRDFDAMGGPGEREATTGLVAQLAENFGLSLETLPTLMTDKLAAIGNPFEPVGQWLQEGMNEISRFFVPQEMAAGLGGAGMGDTSGIGQMFSGIVEGIGAGMDQAVLDLGALAEEKKTGFKNALGDFFGPIGQFLFPSEDAIASEAGLGDPAAMGQQFGEALTKTFTDPAFEESLNKSIDALPKETFQATGAQLLGAISEGMKTAMTEAAPSAAEGGLPAAPMGQQMVQNLATGLTDAITAAPPELFTPMANALGTQLGTALSTSLVGAQMSSQDIAAGTKPAAGAGLQLVQGLATGLTESITAAPPELFAPMANALGTQLGTALQTGLQGQALTSQQIAAGAMPAAGAGLQLVQGLATGLTDSITAAPAETFVPMSNALGAKLGEAMSLAAQPVQPPGGVGPVAPDSGVGTSMVAGLATGLTDSITAAPIETFHPVANALGAKLGEAWKTAMTQTVGVGEQQGGAVGADAAGGIGQTMVQGLATGLQTSIAEAPVETFAPVGAALGTKLSDALTTAVGAADGEGTSDVGAQLGDAVGQAITGGVQEANWDTVGTALGTKLGETLQTVAEGGGELDVSEQVGASVGQMLQSGIEGADFAGVGESLTTQLSDQMTTAIEEVSSGIEEAMSGMTEAISEAVSQMGEAIGQATEQVGQAVEEMSAGIEEATGAVSEAVAEMSAAVEEAAGSMEEAASSASEAASQVGDAASEAAEAVSSAMQEMASSVAAAAGAIASAAGQIVAALNSIAAAAGAAGAAIGAALAGGFSGELGISSPSKVFVGFGKNIVQGLSLGMTSGQSILSRGSKQLAKASMTSLASAIGMGSPAKKFLPHGRAITDGMLQGMLEQAKGRLQSAMGTMAGAVESAMGKVKSAVQSGMERVRGEGARQASAAGAEAATAHAEGMTSEERQAERAARKLWRRAYRELMSGVGAARFLGEEWAREFWEGMLDSSGTLAFAQFVTGQIVGAAENAIAAAMGRIAGLAVQLEIVANTISGLEGDISSLESQLATIDSQIANQAQQARINAVREELRLQQELTRELEARFKTEFSAAHLAHIRAVQTGSAAAQADYEAKLRQAQATKSAIAESQIREGQLSETLNAMLAAIEQAVKDELAARRAAIAEELAMKRQLLAEERALQADLLASQMAAQLDYTQAVIAGSQDRIRQLEKELKKASGPEQKAEIRAQIALEQQRIENANQLAAALQAQATAGTPEALAQATAQVAFLTAQIQALGDVDVGSLLGEIVSTLSETATALSTAATSMSDAATALGETDVTQPMAAASGAVAEFGTEAGIAARGADSMAAAYDKAMAGMNEDSAAFNAQFQGMLAKTQGDAAQGGADIGLALSQGITSRIDQGAPALQKSMLDGLQTGVDATDAAAETGATDIAGTFGAAMRDQLGVQLPKVHQDILSGMTRATDATAKEAAQGGKDVAATYGSEALAKLQQDTPKFQTAMSKGVTDGVRDAKHDASRGGNDIGAALSDGIKKGVDDRAQGIADAAAKTVADAIKAAKDKAQAASPSKRMMELGDDMGLGLILGLRGRQPDAEEASRGLVHIPMSPTSSGGVSGRRAMEERRGTTVHIERLELPGVRDPEQFIAAMEDLARTAGVSSGRG